MLVPRPMRGQGEFAARRFSNAPFKVISICFQDWSNVQPRHEVGRIAGAGNDTFTIAPNALFAIDDGDATWVAGLLGIGIVMEPLRLAVDAFMSGEMPPKRTHISTTRWITSGDELKRRNGLGGVALDLRGIAGR